MLVGNSVRGIVSLQNLDKENAFTQSDIDLLMTLANSMSLSLENARLFNETERLLKQIEDELQIAQRTQRSILPPRMPRYIGYDFGALIRPARAIGGDFYDSIHLDKDRLALVIGDVSDKGLPAALFMALTVSLLRAEAERSNDTRQVLLSINRYLFKMNAPGMFVTLLYGILDCRTGAFSYTRAGHLSPIVVGPNGEGIQVRSGEGQPLGLFKDVKLDAQEVTIPRGGLALLFSDGLNEAADALGNPFGNGRINQELSANRGESASMICRKLWDAVNRFSGAMPHQDDFVALVVKRHA
jgi:sigma-B regulation protein RsbU (phosphoserine phosphatase)